MKRSSDLVIGKSGDRNGTLATEARRREGEQLQEFTAETRRRGEERSGHRDQMIGQTAGTCHYLAIEHTAFTCHPERHGATQERGKVEGPRTSVPCHAASGSSHETSFGIPRWLRYGWHLLRATLREIFDESAYDRFLERTNASRSVATYRAFTQERDAALLTKPRCC
jgi:hypothetical protein